MSKIIDGIEFRKSTRRGKKYMAKPVYSAGPWVHFGAKGMAQYHDRIGEYAHFDHWDTARRKRYRDRHRAIRNANGQLVYRLRGTPAYYSYYYLW